MNDIEWNLEALHDDAEAWTCVSRSLDTVDELLNRARLTQGDFMTFLPSSARAASGVSSAVAAIQSFASQGSDRALEGSHVLLEVAEAYRANEDAARRELEGLWEPESR